MNLDAQAVIGLGVGPEFGAALRQRPSLSRFHERCSEPTASLFWNNEPSLYERHRRAAGPFSEFAQSNFNKSDRSLAVYAYDKNSPTSLIGKNLCDFPVTILAAIRPKPDSQQTIIGHKSVPGF
ncbi:MAG TPA: hypothetical protein VFB14_26785 [Bryobacteraceae bacterium]|jgi:hypothetical protein|nr:hypothetical protein [Bryobacteraceae bacterium]